MLKPLEEVEEEEGEEISFSQSALMCVPPQLVPPKMREAVGNYRQVRAIDTGGGSTTILPMHGDMISMDIAKGTKAPSFEPPKDAWEDCLKLIGKFIGIKFPNVNG